MNRGHQFSKKDKLIRADVSLRCAFLLILIRLTYPGKLFPLCLYSLSALCRKTFSIVICKIPLRTGLRNKKRRRVSFMRIWKVDLRPSRIHGLMVICILYLSSFLSSTYCFLHSQVSSFQQQYTDSQSLHHSLSS